MKRSTLYSGCAVLLILLLSIRAEAWEKAFGGGGGHAEALALGRPGEVVGTGVMVTGAAFDATEKMGGFRWRKSIPGAEASEGRAVAAPGDIFAGGLSVDPGLLESFTVARYAALHGVLMWAVNLPPARFRAAVEAIVTDGLGDVVAGGFISEASPQDLVMDFVIAKLAGGSGAELWRATIPGATFPGATTGGVARHALVLDSLGDVIAAGATNDPPGSVGFTVVKLLGATGGEVWRYSPDEGGEAEAVLVDPAGDVFAAGSLADGSGNATFVVVKLAGATGSELWRYSIVGIEDVNTAARGLVLLDSGDPIAVGGVKDGTGVRSTAVRLDGASGAEAWRQTIEGYTAFTRGATDGNEVAAIANFIVAKFDVTTGSRHWLVDLPGIDDFDFALLRDVGMTDAGRVVVAGQGKGRAMLAEVTDRLSGKRLRLSSTPGASLRLDSSDRFVLASGPHLPADPTVSGATLHITNPTTHETTSIPLPASGWTASERSFPNETYDYVDSTLAAGPCSSVQIANGKRLRVRCSGPLLFTLDESAQGAVAVELDVGTDGVRYCMLFGGTVTADEPGLFDAKNAPAPADCTS